MELIKRHGHFQHGAMWSACFMLNSPMLLDSMMCVIHCVTTRQSFLPCFAVIEEAAHHDNSRMVSLCAGLQAGEIVVFDKAYVHFEHLFSLAQRGIFWISRAKDNMAYRVCRKRIRKREGNILRDDEVTPTVSKSRAQYPQRLRRIEAQVEINGKVETMVFITNNLLWSPASICGLYKSRWAIEVFFKQIKQTLQIYCRSA